MVDMIRFSRRGSSRRGHADALFETRADGRFEGYASVFGVADQSGDVMARGAFRRSLGVRGPGGVKLLYQHVAAEPIGVWTEIYEDAVGLFARGRLLTELSRGHDVLALMREGALDGLSVGFKTVKARTEKSSGSRTIYDADLWEISVVTFPMLDRARVLRVG